LMHKKADKPEQSTETLKFFDWAYSNGDKMADGMDYVPMPDSVKKVVRESWKQIADGSGKAVWK
jgi:phosphate transport system substrate-binding protein